MRVLLINLSVPLFGVLIGWMWIKRTKERNKVRVQIAEAVEIRYLIQELSVILTEFSAIHELRVKIQTADESELSDILHVTYHSLSVNERSPLLLEGEHDRHDFVCLLTRKERRYLDDEIPYYLTTIFERTWTLRDGYEMPDDVEETEVEGEAEGQRVKPETSVSQSRVKCCMCPRPANLIVFRYKSGEYIPPWSGFNRSDIPEIMEWEHAWFTACSRGCMQRRMEQARESGEFNDTSDAISVKEIVDDE